jgi:DNA-binding NtrC family response regulator
MSSVPRVLVVDDDPSVRILIAGLLEGAGYQTASAANATQALKLLGDAPFDLVVTDKNMSGMDGHMLVTEIALRHPQIGAVIITGYRTEESERRALEQHVLGYLEKPIYDLDKVTQTVQHALAEQKRRLGLA